MRTAAILIARLIFAADFAIAAGFKFAAMDMTASQIANVGFPVPHLLGWLAAIFELALIFAFLTGAFFTEACVLAIVYVLFLGFTFYGPSHWSGNPMMFGLFVTHFIFTAGLLLAAVTGPGRAVALRWSFINRNGRD